MFAIINIVIVFITGKSRARAWSWLQDNASQFYLVPISNPSGSKYSVAQGLSSRCRSKMFNCVLLVFSIRPQLRHCRQQSSPMINLWEKLWPSDQINIIGHLARVSLRGLKEGYHQKNTDFESYLLVKLQSIFKFSTIFFKCIKAPTEKCTFQTTKNILDFIYFYCFRFSFYIFHR